MSRPPGRYARQTLRPGEEVIAIGRYHWLYTVIAVLCLLLLGRFLIGVVIFARMMSIPAESSPEVGVGPSGRTGWMG